MQREVSVPPLHSMVIQYHAFPKWRIHVSRIDKDVVRVQDVFEALYEDLQRTLGEDDMEASTESPVRGKRSDRRQRFKHGVKIRAGMRRADLLAGNTWFLGLKRPEGESGYWIAEFGTSMCRTCSLLSSCQ
ncbi:hypothetical protein L226DRAFT_343248 [Lentinus tigrinus ALCF2SS1-7]|uniref:uncharacterized protein n=1 Tax=Lentinus tigrinus ALCF2SS1-7 TaxID=1328758 RepID=UPI001165F275|nr:hypothetical protein L226DRAFT_343248 [Lentinus tigrinus ALCF2SS1-7]